VQKHENMTRVIFISCVAVLGGFLFGYDSGVINGTVSALQKAFGSSDVGSGFNVASMLLGCALGALLAGRLSDRFGRRSVLIVTAIFFGVSAWGSGIASASLEFIVYRVIGGFAVGAASVVCPAYISEVSPSDIRGRLTTLQQMAIVLGLFFSFLVNYLIAHFSGNAESVFWLGQQAWQWMFWAELVPIILFFTGLLLIPESPRFLVACGRVDQARKVLVGISAEDEVDRLISDIRLSLEEGHRPTWKDMLDPATRKIHPLVWIGIALAALQQLSGINVVFYYGAVLWEAVGFSENNALLINVVSGFVNIGSTIAAIFLVDRWGRRPLLIFGSMMMAVFLGGLALIFGLADAAPDGSLAIEGAMAVAALLFAHLYILSFSVSWGPVVWVLLGEMFPNRFRGEALSLAGLAMWITNFAITFTFPPMLASLGLGGAYGIYAFFAALGGLFAWRLIKETKGKTLEEMN